MRTDPPNQWLDDSETAFRIHRDFEGVEFALYGYQGFWKSPAGKNPATGLAVFPELSVYGASVQGKLGTGTGNIEAGIYHSEDDSNGRSALIRNSEFRILAGYEQPVSQDFKLAFQYYLEKMLDYGAYQRALPAGTPKADENRHLLTLRITRLLLDQDLTLSLFTFYSPSDNDAYFRPTAHYRLSEYFSFELGGNFFTGRDDHTFFGQYEGNGNVYAGFRISF
ncbi:MAG: hypothetical protein KJ645_12900 [Planctomycetes bacterium]|nr:hypothetical protein [Planctomycetota bacterium]